MRRFLVDCLAFLAIQALLLAGIESLYQVRLGGDHYLAAFRDKDRRLHSVAPPRVLLVGGSSLAFGVNSRAIGRALGRPALNLSLNAGLGLEFILRQAEEALGPGDLVILSPEYDMFGLHQIGDPRVLLQQLSVAPASARFVSVRQLPELLDSGLSLIGARLHALQFLIVQGPSDGVYRRSSFDEWGDVVAHHGLPTQLGRNQHVGVPSRAQVSRACARLNVFAGRARSRGARAVLAPVPIPADDLAAQDALITEMWSSVGGGTEIPVLKTDRAYPRDLFFDTAYHLTLAGKRLRTRSLLAALQGTDPQPGPP